MTENTEKTETIIKIDARVTGFSNDQTRLISLCYPETGEIIIQKISVHDKFHRALVLSGFFFVKIASTFLNSSFFPKPIKRRIAI